MSEQSDSWEPELQESQLHGYEPEYHTSDPILEVVSAPRGRRAIPI